MSHAHPRPMSSDSSPTPTAPRPALILLVEDDPLIRELMAEVLSAEGYVVEEADNGRAALERLSQRGPRPALIILDLMMPELNGWELIEAIKQQRLDRTTSVMVLSALSDSATPLPRVRWLRKPILPEDLLLAVKAALAALPAA